MELPKATFIFLMGTNATNIVEGVGIPEWDFISVKL
jgi:hypothetical protein